MDKNAGYKITVAVLLSDQRGFALGESPTAPNPYVSWQFTEEAGKRDYYWGHYFNDRASAEKDVADRMGNHMRQFSAELKQLEMPGLYKYYSTQRPVDIGTFPKPYDNRPDEIVNFDKRVPVEGGAFAAWGYLTYTKPLTRREAADYELRPAPKTEELWREEPRPIAQQMKEAAEQARREARPPAPGKDAPDREGR